MTSKHVPADGCKTVPIPTYTTPQAGRPLELFLEEEQEALIPLPRCPYDSSEVALQVYSIEGYLEFETNRYPVPFEYYSGGLLPEHCHQCPVAYRYTLRLQKAGLKTC